MDALDTGIEPAAINNGEPSSKLDKDALFLTLQKQIRADLEHSAKWRDNARDEYAFVAGPGQWTPEDRQKLADEMRPCVTFNKVLKFVLALCGIEENNKREITFIPRDMTEPGEVLANEMLSVGSDWMADGCDAASEQSRAFRDTVICGMGWTEGNIETDDDPLGQYVETRCDPLEMFWDRNARSKNLSDAKRRGRIRKMTLEEAKNLIPGVTDAEDIQPSDLDAHWATNIIKTNSGANPKTQEQKELREENTIAYDDSTDVHVVQVQWIEHEPYIRAVDLRDRTGKKTVDLSEEQFAQLTKRLQGVKVPHSKLRRKKWKQAFLGGKVLHVGDCPRKDGFTLNCSTWEPDDIAGTWFGIVRVLRDPAEWSNKFFSQLMHMINSTAKGGIMAEEDVFTDPHEAQKSWARTNAITMVKKGALSGGRVQPKPGAAITGGVAALLQVADAAFGDTSGVNLELMGLADRQQAGVLEAQRKQAAMTILATLFAGYSGFMRDVGGMRLYFLQNFFADDRLIRVKGKEGYEALPLVKDQLLGRYDVIVGDAPSSPNAQEQVWASIQPLMPLIQTSGEAVAAVLDYVPNIPAKLVTAFKKILSAPNPKQEKKEAVELAGEEADVAKTQADTQQSIASAALALAKAGRENAQQANTQLDSVMKVVSPIGEPRAADDAPILSSTNSDWRPSSQPPPLPEVLPSPVIPASNGVIPPGGII